MKQKRVFTGLVVALFIFSVVPVLWGQAKTAKATIVKSEDGEIVFKTEAGEEVQSKISSKRTRIMIGDKTGDASALKAGDKIEITYVLDGNRNEPSLIKVTK